MKTILKMMLVIPLLYLSSCSEDSSSTPGADERDRFTGSWSCKETISGSAQTFMIQVSKIGDEDTMSISNFSNYGSTADAIAVVSGNSLTIPAQNIGITSIPVGGTGIYSANGSTEKINMNYSTDGSAATAVCTK